MGRLGDKLIARVEYQAETLAELRQLDDKRRARICELERKLGDAEREQDRLAAEVETLRQQFDNAQRELSEQGLVHGVEGWQEAADLQKQLNAAQAALTRERLDAEERDKELERLRAFVAQVRSVVESEWYGVEMPAVRELLAQLDARTIKPVPVTEPAPCPDWRAALAELDAEGGA